MSDPSSTGPGSGLDNFGTYDDDAARGVEDVDGGRAVDGRDLDGRVGLGRGGAADEQRRRHVAPLHLLGHVDHLVQRRRNQTRKADDVCRGNRSSFSTTDRRIERSSTFLFVQHHCPFSWT